MLGSSRSVRLGFYISASLVCALIIWRVCIGPRLGFRPSHQAEI